MEKHIYNFFYKTKGVISTFLVIVLVPIVTACCLYVDSCRVLLAKSVIESSGDLALNTVLSNFDGELADLYGLMASAQNDNEIKNNAKEYFKKSMISQGLEDAYADKFSQALSNSLMGEEFDVVDDLLGIDTTSVEINPVSNGNLANSTIIKQQIVEFMKYRGPIDVVSELWDKFQKIKDNVMNSKEIAKLTEDADEYYEHESDALKALEKAYEYLLYYNDINSSNSSKEYVNINAGINKSYIDKIVKRISSKNDGIYVDYKTWHKYHVYDLCTYTKYNPNKTAFTKRKVVGYDENYKNLIKSKVGDGVSINTIKTKLGGSSTTIGGLQKAYKECIGYANTIANLRQTKPYKSGATYDTQYWIQMEKELKSNNLMNSYLNRLSGKTSTGAINTNSIVYQIAYIKIASEKLPESELEKTENLPYDATTFKVQSYKEAIEHWEELVQNECPANDYNLISNNIANFCNDNKSSVDSELTTVSQGVYRVSKELNDYYDDLDYADHCLGVSKSYLNDAKSALEKMRQSFEEWQRDYNSSNSQVKNDDTIKKQYEEAKKTIEELGIDEESVERFIGRVNNVKSLLGAVFSAISKFKYGNSAIKNIDSFDKFKNASGVSYDKVSMTKNQLSQLNKDTFSITIPDVSGCNVTNNNNPNFNTGNNNEVYVWMTTKFDNPKTKSKDRKDKEKEYEDEVEKEDDSTSEADTKGNESKGKDIIKDYESVASLPSKIAKAKKDNGVEVKKEDSSNISNMAGSVAGLVEDIGDSIIAVRDKLYVMLYITKMFSYDTYEKEKDYKKSVQNGNEDKFERCTLTNIPINEDNNFAYGSEIEYIIYGNSNSKNKAASYGTIYAIRYALDLMFALTKFWSGSNTTATVINSTAIDIAAATSGVIPAPLTKLVMILGLTGLEAANDIKILKDGYPLSIYKRSDCEDWKFTIDVKGDEKVKKANTYDGAVTLQYSDYLTLILLLKLITNEKPILLRTADVIQTNMHLRQSGFLMSKCNVYYQLTANCKNSIMMLAIPVVQGSLKSSNIKVQKFNEFSITLYRGY